MSPDPHIASMFLKFSCTIIFIFHRDGRLISIAGYVCKHEQIHER